MFYSSQLLCVYKDNAAERKQKGHSTKNRGKADPPHLHFVPDFDTSYLFKYKKYGRGNVYSSVSLRSVTLVSHINLELNVFVIVSSLKRLASLG